MQMDFETVFERHYYWCNTNITNTVCFVHTFITVYLLSPDVPRPPPGYILRSKHSCFSFSDQVRTAFTPFSLVLGSTLKELHRSLLLAVVSENYPLTLTQLVKVSQVVSLLIIWGLNADSSIFSFRLQMQANRSMALDNADASSMNPWKMNQRWKPISKGWIGFQKEKEHGCIALAKHNLKWLGKKIVMSWWMETLTKYFWL